MSLDTIPILRLEFRGMQANLLHVIHEHHEEIEQLVDEELKLLLSPERFRIEIRKALEPLLRQTVADALKDAVHKALWSKEVKSLLETDVHSALLRVLKEYYPYSENKPENV